MSSNLKKAELHVHLEGTISPKLAHELAERNRIFLPEDLIKEPNHGYFSRDFLHFLSVYDTVASLIKTPEDYYTLTFDYLKTSAAEGVIYSEFMYSPDHAEKMTQIPSKEHLAAIAKAIEDAELKFGIIGRVLITIVRHFGPDAAIRVATEAVSQPLPYVVGLGMGGDELGFPPQMFQKAFQIAHQAGLPCTAHSGEFAPAGGMLDALTYLPLKRIGHGVQAIHSPELMSRLRDEQIMLEICPSSNVKFGVFPRYEEHPFPKFFEYGIPVSINSDDPPFIPVTVAEEYAKVQSMFGYTDEVMNQITRMAIDHSFAEESVKEKLRDALNM